MDLRIELWNLELNAACFHGLLCPTQAIGQVLENAAKYSPRDSLITVTARSEHERLVISITDEGSGLTAAEQKQVGRRSFRGERSHKASSGSGLGLWIAQCFVTANGGMLEAQSRGAGQGTTISIQNRVSLLRAQP